MNTSAVLEAVQDGELKVVGSANISGAVVTDFDEFECHLQGLDLNRTSGSALTAQKRW